MLRQVSLRGLLLALILFSCRGKAPLKEKVLFDFETHELQKFGKTALLNDTVRLTIPSYAVSTDPLERPMYWTCVKNAHANVSFSYMSKLPAAGPESDFSTKGYPDYAAYRGKAVPPASLPVFKTSDLRYQEYSLEKDWSGFDRLRADVFSANEARIWLSIEDTRIEPPVTADFTVPAGKWVTLDMDLKAAQKQRNLRLAEMANIFIGGRSLHTTQVFIDNIRISGKRVTAPFPLVINPGPYEPNTTAARAAAPFTPFSDPVHKKLVSVPRAVRVPAVFSESMTLAPCGWTNAFDDNRMFLSFAGNKGALLAVQTLDAGRTWTGLSGGSAPTRLPVRNLDHGTARGRAVGTGGLNLIVSSGPGCAGWGVPSPRQRIIRILPDGPRGWKLDKNMHVLDSDIRHCGNSADFLELESGRIWAAWGHLGRELTMGIHAKYSDDQGVTWQSFLPGQAPAVQGSFDDSQAVNTYQYKQVRLFRYNRTAGMVWRESGGLYVSIFNGDHWVRLPQPGPVMPVLTPESKIRPQLSAVSVDAHVFIASSDVRGVLHWDGVVWKQALDSARDAGLLTVSQKTVVLITPGPSFPGPKKTEWIESEIFYYVRSPGGEWSEKRSLTRGPVPLYGYRGIYGVSVPAVSPPNRVPVACNGRPGEGMALYFIPNPYYRSRN